MRRPAGQRFIPPVLVSLLIRWACLAVAFALTDWILDGMDVSGGTGAVLWVALLFGLVNAILGTILRVFTLPLTIITLGLFSVIVNAIVLEVTDALTSHLTIDDFFWTAIWAAILLSVVAVVVDVIVSALMPSRQ
jgi:putative membrane protein